MPRKQNKPEPNLLSRGAFRAWPPTCGQCGFEGEPNGEQSPYIACTVDGVADPARHQRQPVGAS